jgi:CRISPR associated protein Cas2.
MRYVITYDLMKPGKDYEPLWKALASIGAVRILASVWLVRRTGTTPKGIGDYLVGFMDANDRIFVTEVPDNYAYKDLLADPSRV